jgi:hypothetical protein
MKLAKAFWSALAAAVLATTLAGAASAGPIQERVPGGVLELDWLWGYSTPNEMMPATLDPSHPAYNNPSGDHTVAVATTALVDSGGLIVTMVNTEGVDDYTWEGWMFTGNGDTRRGLLVRTSADGRTFYHLVIDPGLSQIKLRKFVNGVRETPDPRVWLVTVLPQLPNANEWHKLKVEAQGNTFRCWWDDYELTSDAQGAFADPNPILTGWVGCYNFWPTISHIDAYFDDLVLTKDGAVPARVTTWGGVKARWR